ncbi:Oidioi.mRNA.OKI2018_I69.PAR.g10426.t1.cds [Oikopleura dioica]|uniref:Oidioi.mRNA.OKI2018_I69.PAR.g10426.t1.cds n=1 Tax=Oikopleura dioica TaxID=34765 RepID=A0ABN7RUK4_OIKDI|nr:Oidioi.mRNA.OKI2018_I69.PAR.g10426.t1.cds [Oikopleura dioica]
MILQIAGNLIYLITYLKHKKLRKKRHYLIRTSYSFIDLTSALVELPMAVIYLLKELDYENYNYYADVCSMSDSWVAVVCGTVTLTLIICSHILWMQVDRYIAICHPFIYSQKSMYSSRHIIYCLVITWLVSGVLSVIPVMSNSVHFVLSPTLLVYIAYPDEAVREVRTWKKMTVHGTVFVLPFLLSVAFAVRTGKEVLKILNSANGPMIFDFMKDKVKKENSDATAVFKMTLLWNFCYSICIIPFITVTVLMYEGILNCSSLPLPFFLSFYLTHLNGMINLFMHFYQDEVFISIFRESLPRMCRPVQVNSSHGSRRESKVHWQLDDCLVEYYKADKTGKRPFRVIKPVDENGRKLSLATIGSSRQGSISHGFHIPRVPSGSCVTQVTEIPGSINIGSTRRGSFLTIGSITRQSFSAECAVPNLQTIVQEEEDALLEVRPSSNDPLNSEPEENESDSEN